MSVTAAAGFLAGGVACGIKPDGALDLALVATENGAPAAVAGVFTTNRATAAPVLVSRVHLSSTGGRAVAVVLNSGNANAASGAQGRVDAARTCALVAGELGCRPEEVLVCSTGLIGIPLPMGPVAAGVPALTRSLRADGGPTAAEAIRTTDTVRKEVVVETDAGFVVGGMAKGAAMLAPDMATMLAVLTTDAVATPRQLDDVLRAAMPGSFHALSVDGCTSTNDTVLLLASGTSGRSGPEALADAVAEACASLAQQMAADAEGATKVVEVRVDGAASDGDAHRAARGVAESALCKCSWYGCDPYWGRVVSELGSSGAVFDPDTVAVAYGPVTVCRDGIACPHDAGALAAVMGVRHLTVSVDLGLGTGSAMVLTNDLTHAYVDENMGTS